MELLITSVKQIGVILVAVNGLVLLTEHGVIGDVGWRIACIMLLALGVFLFRIYAEIVYVGMKAAKSAPTPEQ